VVELTTMRGFTATVSLLAGESLPQAAARVAAPRSKGMDFVTRTSDEVRGCDPPSTWHRVDDSWRDT
jgi:hypothetical protein